MYYTSYFGNMNKIDRTKYTLASISFQKPDFCDENVLDCSFLGPWKDLLDGYKNGTISEKEYADQYLKTRISSKYISYLNKIKSTG